MLGGYQQANLSQLQSPADARNYGNAVSAAPPVPPMSVLIETIRDEINILRQTAMAADQLYHLLSGNPAPDMASHHDRAKPDGTLPSLDALRQEFATLNAHLGVRLTQIGGFLS